MRGEIFLHLDCEVDQVLVELAVAERVGHPRVQLRYHQAAARTDTFDGGREDVHLDPERYLPLTGSRSVQQHDIRLAHSREQPWDERKTHRQVVQPLTGVAHPRPDERRLENHTVACGQRRLRREHEQPIALHRPLQRVQQASRGGEIPARDDRLQHRQRPKNLLELPLGDHSHLRRRGH